MPRLIYTFLIALAVASVAVADVFLKQAAVSGNWSLTMKSPWLWGAMVLYLYQILCFTYVFVTGGELSFVGSLQTILYALVVVGAGIFLFQEKLTGIQALGITLAIGGAILINLN